MKLHEAIEHLRQDLQRFADSGRARPGAIGFKQTVVNTIIAEFNRQEAYILELEAMHAAAIGRADHAWGLLERQILWCRLYGIPDGCYQRSDGRIVYTEDRDLDELQRAIDVRLARFAEEAKQGLKAQGYLFTMPDGRIAEFPPQEPWCDGDWDQRKIAADAALSAQALDRALTKFTAGLTSQQRATWERMCAELEEPAIAS